MSLRYPPASLVCLAFLLLWVGPAGAGHLSASASNPDATTIAIHFIYWEYEDYPAGHPEWVGFDVERRSSADCGAWIRVNDQPFPRSPGESYDYVYTETPPAQQTLYEYRVLMVDANRNALSFGWPQCDLCHPWAWASSPENSAFATVARLHSNGLWLDAAPAYGCYGTFYIEGTPFPELYDYADTDVLVGLYGPAGGCDSVEGCSMRVVGYEIVDPTPTRAATWGQLKALYRR